MSAIFRYSIFFAACMMPNVIILGDACKSPIGVVSDSRRGGWLSRDCRLYVRKFWIEGPQTTCLFAFVFSFPSALPSGPRL